MMGSDQIRVQIHHRMEEGYPLSADGHEIKEQLPLQEFLRRIFPDEKYVEIEIYRVSKAMSSMYGSRESRELEQCCEVYNKMYIKLFRDRKTVLAQHTLSGINGVPPQYFGGIDPYQQRQRAMAHQSDYERERQMLMQQMGTRPHQGFVMEDPSIKEMHKKALKDDSAKREKKKRDDDLYYLTT